jgi:hypothetical protein
MAAAVGRFVFAQGWPDDDGCIRRLRALAVRPTQTALKERAGPANPSHNQRRDVAV